MVNGNAANATYQGQPLGNLAVGSSATQLNDLIDKWFFGTDLPTLCDTSLVYTSTAGSLFPHTPSHTDEYQGELGDCYFISALGTLADSNPAAVENMFINNGDGTYTVRFYTGTVRNDLQLQQRQHQRRLQQRHRHRRLRDRRPHVADDHQRHAGLRRLRRQLHQRRPTPCGSPWPKRPTPSGTRPARKAADGTNAYASHPGRLDGHGRRPGARPQRHRLLVAVTATPRAGGDQRPGRAQGGDDRHDLVVVAATLCTRRPLREPTPTRSSATTRPRDTFTLYNPWGFDQPGQLTWSQLQDGLHATLRVQHVRHGSHQRRAGPGRFAEDFIVA